LGQIKGGFALMILNGVGQDFRFGLRTLRKAPGFTMVAVLTVALGIGANSAIFTLVNAVLLQPLPYRAPERLVTVGHVYARSAVTGNVSALSFLDYRDQNHVFAAAAAYAPATANLVANGEPERLAGLRISEGLFPLLGVQPAIGRSFLKQDYQPGGESFVVLSDALWRRRFGADRGILGRPVDLSGKPYTVLGVMPGDFRFGPTADFWEPLVFKESEVSPPVRRAYEWLAMIGRLKPGTSLAAARADFVRLGDRMRAQYPDIYPRDAGWRIDVHPYREDVVGNVRPALLILFGVVGFVLLIACINVANLLLARAEGRREEFAVRIALGGGKGDLVKQLLIESSLLAFLGGGLGLLLASLGVSFFLRMSHAWLPREANVSFDGWVLLFTLAVCVLTTFLFGMAPAAQAASVSVRDAINNAARGLMGGLRGRRTRNALVICEVALSLPLVAASVLLASSLSNLMHENPGFSSGQLLVFDVSLPRSRYETSQRAVSFYDRLLDTTRTLPGVRAVGAVSSLPLHGSSFANAFQLEDHPHLPGQPDLIGDLSVASAGYFPAMGIPLLRGRPFSERDTVASPPVAIVDENFARTLFPHGDALGKHLDFEDLPRPRWREIVGIVTHVKEGGLDEASRDGLQYYVPISQSNGVGAWQMSVVVHTAGSPVNQVAAIRSALKGIDPQQPIDHVSTMEEVVSSSLASRRFVAALLGLFAALALVLTAGGLYALISYSIGRQMRAIGIRVALGAQRRAFDHRHWGGIAARCGPFPHPQQFALWSQGDRCAGPDPGLSAPGLCLALGELRPGPPGHEGESYRSTAPGVAANGARLRLQTLPRERSSGCLMAGHTVDCLSELPGMDLGGSLVEEALAVEGVEDPLPLGGRKPLGRRAPRAWLSLGAGLLAAAVEGGPRYGEHLAGRLMADLRHQRGNGTHQLGSSVNPRLMSRISETFFCTAMMAWACFSF